MNKYLFLILIAFCFVGCKSKEDRFKELIDKDLFHNTDYTYHSKYSNLNLSNINFEIAYDIPLNSSICLTKAEYILKGLQQIQEDGNKEAVRPILKNLINSLKYVCDDLSNRDSIIGWSVNANIETTDFFNKKTETPCRFVVDKEFKKLIAWEVLTKDQTIVHQIINDVDFDNYNYLFYNIGEE